MSQVSFSGLASGIDGAKLAQAQYDQQTTANLFRRSRIDVNTTENTKLEKLRELLNSLASKLDSQRSINGGAGSYSASSSDSSIVNVIAGSDAKVGSVAISVESLASNASGSFGRVFNSTSETIGASGEVNVKVGEGDAAREFKVNVSSEMSAQDFVTAFNSQGAGDVQATLVNTGTSSSPKFRVAFSSTSQGLEKGAIEITKDSALETPAALGDTTLSQATNARFSVSGLSGTIERSSNVITDVVSGLSIELKKSGNAAVSVSNDGKSVQRSLESFVSAFNDIAKFTGKEDKVETRQESGKSVNIYGGLAKTNVDDNAVAALRSAISGASSGDGQVSLAALGIVTNRDGTLSFDEEKFTAAFAASPDRAREAVASLADSIGGTTGVVNQYTGFARAIDEEIAGNEAENARVNQSMERLEQNASSQKQGVLNQYSRLEGLVAKMNMDSQYLLNLLKF